MLQIQYEAAICAKSVCDGVWTLIAAACATGEDIATVVAWLQRGRIDREAGLLKALSTVPLVRSLPVAAAAAVPGLPPPAHPPAAQVSLPASAVLAAEGQSEPLPVLSALQLAANRPDGFSGILAPVRLLICLFVTCCCQRRKVSFAPLRKRFAGVSLSSLDDMLTVV
jgi:hypothetical protein